MDVVVFLKDLLEKWVKAGANFRHVEKLAALIAELEAGDHNPTVDRLEGGEG